MKFGQLMKMNTPELFISPRHDAWLRSNSNATYSSAARAFALEQLGKPDRKREGTISASSLNSCGREQQFKFLGLPQLPPTERLAGIFHNGTFTHIRWQMAGLTEGWLEEAEVPMPENEWGLSGTADGLCVDGSLLEVKSINSNGYRGVVQFGAKEDHQYQLGTYLMGFGLDKGRFIYENKDTQDYIEIPFELTEQMRDNIALRAEETWDEINNGNLIEPLGKCIDQEGFRYKGCPFRDRCLGIRSWAEAQTFVKVG